VSGRITKSQRADLVDALHDVGLRATTARVAVLHAVRSADDPVTHEDLKRDLAGNGWDAATIYRNLVALTEAGLVARSDHGDRRWRFEMATTDCGSVRCLPELEVRLRHTASLPRAARSGSLEVQLRGVCDQCAAG
jgi:Fur family ferric uptake transcriptional regulator